MFFTTAFVLDEPNPLDAALNELKKECKELIAPARFEGSRVTYYKISKKTQTKNVEVYFNREGEYVMAFGGKICSVPINIKFYNDIEGTERILVYEEKEIQGKNLVITSSFLNEHYRSTVDPQGRLKIIYIEYEITKGKEKPEGIVLVIGSK
jgi:hypothetical protein